jgi:uncharacterized MnhB-related membrane protein
MSFYPLIILFILGFTLLLIHAKRLITLSIALACLSALSSTLMYLGGASTAAVIELSVGAGLVAVLFAFANGLLSERDDNFGSVVPNLLAIALAVALVGILLTNHFDWQISEPIIGDLRNYFWEERGADIVALMALMFTTVLGVLGVIVARGEESPQAIAKEAHE